MATYAVVKNGEIVNVVEWNGSEEEWQPPAESIAVEIKDGVYACIGWLYDGKDFIAQ